MGPSDDFSREMRRRLRKKLKEDLITVQSLSSKLEARAMQLSQSRAAPVHPSFSDAQFSANGSLYHAAPLPEQHLHEAVKSNASKSNGQPTRVLNARRSSQFPNDLKTHCRNLLKRLMDHEDGWIFNEPVDAVKLGLSDYHSVIKKPMDLGTIKSRVEKRQYKSLPEFADDVKLTFKNAMSYNPPGNDVHQSARMLLTMFERDWDALKERLSKTNGHGELDVLRDSLCQGPRERSSEADLLTTKTASQTRKPLQSQPGSRRIQPGKAKAPVAKSKSSVKPDAKRKSRDNLISEALSNPGIATKSPFAKMKPSSTAKTFTKLEAPTKAKSPVRPIKSAEKGKKMGKASTQTKAKASVKKRAMNYEEKVRLQTLLGQLPQHKLEELIYLMREKISNMSQEGDEIEVDLDSFDDDTLWELHERASDCLKNLHKSPVSRKRPREDNSAGKAGRRQKGPLAIGLEQNATPGKRSSSVSQSSTESDSADSSTSESDG
ncbi:hypothetical protein GOP47_0016755 [Adiantum capillus-veneris]|uniref:Uncharacterized protein n=1 Tax=Adiantum capillus-veneris TaxID=13818 RepID=A0A9D4ZCE0_ADICA|nr:hypothetical protein GOP47_0016755 [Adiantum capillus-veneris]